MRSADRLRWNLGSPFFPLVQSGFEERSTDVVEEFSEVELGCSEELVVRSAGDELAEPMSLALGHLEEEGRVVLGLKLVGCGDGILSHDGSPFRATFPQLHVRTLSYRIIHPLLSCSHEMLGAADWRLTPAEVSEIDGFLKANLA